MSWLVPLRARWQQASRREQLALLGGSTLLLLTMLWLLAVAPALATLRGAEPQRRAASG